jgi:hypothetical protein
MARNRTIQDLRELLFDTIQGVKNGTVDTDKAKVISDLSQVMVNSAKAEVDFVRATGGKDSGFLKSTEPEELPPGITAIRQHKMLG